MYGSPDTDSYAQLGSRLAKVGGFEKGRPWWKSGDGSRKDVFYVFFVFFACVFGCFFDYCLVCFCGKMKIKGGSGSCSGLWY